MKRMQEMVLDALEEAINERGFEVVSMPAYANTGSVAIMDGLTIVERIHYAFHEHRFNMSPDGTLPGRVWHSIPYGNDDGGSSYAKDTIAERIVRLVNLLPKKAAPEPVWKAETDDDDLTDYAMYLPDQNGVGGRLVLTLHKALKANADLTLVMNDASGVELGIATGTMNVDDALRMVGTE